MLPRRHRFYIVTNVAEAKIEKAGPTVSHGGGIKG
jgi:hypothetical protein